MDAALAAVAAARQGKFWEMHDTLFANQQALDKDSLVGYAKALGLDVDKFKKDMADPAVKERIQHDMAVAKALGATGTPAFFVNGRSVSGAKSFEDFKKIVDEELGKVNAKIAKGAPADNAVYIAMSENNKKAFDLLVRNLPVAAPKPPPSPVWKVVVHGDEPMKGNTKDPLVTIVEWSDFQ